MLLKKLKEYLLPLLVTLIGGLLIFYKLGEVVLIEWDESIYAQVAKNVVNSGNWLDFRWFPNSQNLWFEKPPIYIWLTSLSYLVFGVTEFAARLWSAIFGTAGIFVTYLLGKELFGKSAGIISAAILASTIHWVFQSRNATLDITVGFFVLLSLYYFWKAQSASGSTELTVEVRRSNMYWGLTGVSLGLALMTKGAVFIIPVIVMVIYAFIDIYFFKSKKEKYFPRSFLLSALGFLITALPWHAVMLARHGYDFWNNYFGYHILARTKGIEGHANPFLWYRVVIQHWFKHWFVVLVFAVPTLLYLIWKNLKSRWSSGSAFSRKEEIFILLWAGITFIVFSFSVSKIQWYIIPIYPALAIINGRFLQISAESVFSKKRFKSIREKLWKLSYAALIISIPILMVVIRDNREQWLITNYLKGLKTASIYMSEISNPSDILYTYELAPGPPLFYSNRDNNSIGKGQILAFLKDNDSLYVVMREDVFNNSFMDEPEVIKYGEILFNENGYVLLGNK